MGVGQERGYEKDMHVRKMSVLDIYNRCSKCVVNREAKASVPG